MQGNSLRLTSILVVASAFVLSQGCAGPPPKNAAESPPGVASGSAAKEVETTTTRAEQQPPPTEPQAEADAATAKSAPDLRPPEPGEIGGVVARVFGDAVTVDAGGEPSFVVGDFNGDRSPDVAVVVRPAPEKLAVLNDELAAWILVAPFAPEPNGPANAGAAGRRRVFVDEGDSLLAVVHGFESKGWRDPRATQTYVLKGAGGGLLETRKRELLAAHGRRARLPRLWGDVIAQDADGGAGFFYYNGAKYAWFNPRRDRPPAPARPAHGVSVEQARQ